MRPVLLFSCFLLFCTGCRFTVFLDAQPRGGKNLDAFPAKYFGRYVLEHTHDSLIIDSSGLTIVEVRGWKNDSLSHDTLSGDVKMDSTIKNMTRGSFISLHATQNVHGDSVTRHNYTTLQLNKSDSCVLRVVDNAYLLNLQPQWGQSYWIVLLLKFSADGKTLRILMPSAAREKDSQAVREADLKKFRAITSISEQKGKHETDYMLDPSPDQLKKLIAAGFFRELFVLKR